MIRPSAIAGLSGRSVLTLEHHDPDAVDAVLDLAARLKGERAWPDWLAGRVIALIFERPSTRTRISFQSGIARLGGTAMVLSSSDLQMGRGETVADTARVLSRMVDAIMLRTGGHDVLQELADNSDVPVINGLTYDHHPCQALADAQTLRERFGALAGLRMTYVGDGNNVVNSLMVLAGLTGIELVCSCPEGYLPDAALRERSDRRARERGGWVRLEGDPRSAVDGARAIYTDTWVSMGDEQSEARRLADLDPYRLDADLLRAAAPDAIALHCLPAHHGHEITTDVLYGAQSAVWDQAENRMHAQAALLAYLLAD